MILSVDELVRMGVSCGKDLIVLETHRALVVGMWQDVALVIPVMVHDQSVIEAISAMVIPGREVTGTVMGD